MLEILIGALIICTLIGTVASMFGGSPRSFQELGDITGMSLEEISAKVGAPSSASAMEGGMLYQWISTSSLGGYHYAIAFDETDHAIGYTHQHVS